ncbi:MAG TPA: hypothetical protein VHJ20_22930 [Polyangia bacterium]|nr:hypothetical protein [Polyangia bacterium]
MKRSKTGLLLGAVVGGVFVLGTLLGTRVAVSGKVTDSGGGAPVNTGPSPMPAPGGCDNAPSYDLAQKLVGQVIDAKKWTQKDHEKIAPLFYGLHTDQKIEILKRVGAALDSRRLVVEKGARLF